MMSAPHPAVAATALGRAYRGRWAIADVHIELAPGRSLLLAGPNGAGKTTLLRLLATAIRPSTGTIHLHGIDTAADPVGVRNRLALLSHRGHLYSELSALQNLSTAADISGREADLLGLLDRVGLHGRANDAVRTFSAGMRKRLAFARLLLQEPDIVLLDEPYGQLDPSGFALVDRLIGELQDEGRTLVLSTHLVDRGAALLQSGMVLVGGRVQWVGPATGVPDAMAAIA
jgi:heme exporter protein A